MKKNTIDSTGNQTSAAVVGSAAANPSRQSAPPDRVADLLGDRRGLLPVWVRAPKGGPEHYTGFSRSKMYDLAAKGLIRAVAVREPGRVTGTRLFDLGSILNYIERAAAAAE